MHKGGFYFSKWKTLPHFFVVPSSLFWYKSESSVLLFMTQVWDICLVFLEPFACFVEHPRQIEESILKCGCANKDTVASIARSEAQCGHIINEGAGS